jgi:hypothetical protein
MLSRPRGLAWGQLPDSEAPVPDTLTAGMTIVLQKTGFNRRAERSHSTGQIPSYP